jgi:hypothetical protein
MPLHLPDFRQEYLSGITACAWFHASKDYSSDFRMVKAWSKYVAGDTNVVIGLIIDSDDGIHYHLHLEIDRESSGRKPPPVFTELLIDDLKKQVEVFFGEDSDIYWDARFAIPRDTLPKHGMIQTLLGVNTESCGADLDLTGSKFAIRGDIFTEVEWDWDEGTDCIHAKIGATTETVIGDQYLTNAADFLGTGMECFVLESLDKSTYANKQQPNIQKRAEA